MACKRRRLNDGRSESVCSEAPAHGEWKQPLQDEMDEVVCFGTIREIAVHVDDSLYPQNVEGIKVLLDPSRENQLVKLDGKSVARIVDPSAYQLLSAIAEEHGINFQLQIYLESSVDNAQGTSQRAAKTSMTAFLSAIIYGPMKLFEVVGDFFQDNNRFLQDPSGCDRNVRYRNPHRILGLEDVSKWTFDLDTAPINRQEIKNSMDLLAGLETDETLPESETPPALKTPLHSHQKQALSFMKRREKGWALHSPSSDVWTVEKSPSEARLFVNNVTGYRQDKPPPIFRGGIMADDMGLGKTISMIALIASDPRANTPAPNTSINSSECCRATLVVVPSSLLQQWEDQLTQHLRSSGLGVVQWIKHHGLSRIANRDQLQMYDIAITSFQTVVSEYRKHCPTPSLLFSTVWHRIVLDEAHTIRNQNTVTAKAVFELKAAYRWAVTGTPLQNRLSDFSSLLQFLRVYPYSDRKVFEADIINVWKREDEALALERLKRLFKFIAIRRPRSAIKLPERTDLIQYIHFNTAELDAYRQVESPIAHIIDDALHQESRKPGSYMHTLLRINALRKFCNVGIETRTIETSIGSPGVTEPGSWSGSEAHAVVEELLNSGQAVCTLCDSDVRYTSEDSASPIENLAGAFLTECIRLICLACYRPTGPTDLAPQGICKDHPACRITQASTTLLPQIGDPAPDRRPALHTVSSKVLALRTELQNSKCEKSVIFSSWTTTLDMVQDMLIAAKISFTRIDGRISAKNRAANLYYFQENPKVQVMLLTISCGAEGLNLVAASRVYLMEPQWNPNIEEQALARIHRIGQTRQVTTIRFIVKDSIEDHVINIQDRKKHLANLLLSQEKSGLAIGNNSYLQYLRDLLN